MKNKKPLIIALVAIDVVITITLLVISIVMLANTVGKTAAEILNAKGFIGYLQNHTTFYFCLFVLPLFILLAANIIGLVIYVRKTAKAEPVKVNDLTEEQKAELRKQILADLQKEQTKMEAPAETSKPEEK
jgi:uncharacterized membrane protein